MSTPDRHPDVAVEPRISDADRERCVDVLRTSCGDGRISLEEFGDRIDIVYRARTRAELDDVLADLARPQLPERPPTTTRRGVAVRRVRSIRWQVAAFGKSQRRGGFQLGSEAGVVAVCGESVLDLTNADLAEGDIAINAVAMFGQVTIIVPDDVDVDVDGSAFLGEKRVDPRLRYVGGRTRIVVQALAVCGQVDVRLPRRRARTSFPGR